MGAHFAKGGLEPVPVDASTGSTKQEKTRKQNRVPNAVRLSPVEYIYFELRVYFI